MKRVLFLCLLLIVFFTTSCHLDYERTIFNDDTDHLDSVNVQTISDSEQMLANECAKLWDDFRFAILNNDPDFDPIKFYYNESMSPDVFMILLEDDYTKEVLSETSFDLLEDAVFDGLSVKVFHVIISAAGELMGTSYFFHISTNDLQLVGTAPF